jgi:hypothetical protein
MTCFPELRPDRIRVAGCYEVTRRNQYIPVREMTFSLRSIQVKLTTKLTTERLDVLGRL